MKYLLCLVSMLYIGSLSAQEIDIKNDFPKEDIIYVISIDGEQIEIPKTEDVLNDLEAEWVDYINVLKGNSIPLPIRTAYKDVKGVINIGLKSGKEGRVFFDQLQTNLEVVVIKEKGKSTLSVKKVYSSLDAKIKINKNEEVKILLRIHIEEKVFSVDKAQKFLNDIDPEDIESINVLKDETSLKKYDALGKDGVIEIRVKNNKAGKKLLKQLQKGEKDN